MANPLSNDDEFVWSLKSQIEHKVKLLEECASGAAQETMYSVVNEPVEIKKQVLSLLETASLCAPSPEMQQFKESMKAKVHLASGKALQCLNTRIECDEGVVTVSFTPAKPAEVVLGTPSPAENARQSEDERSRRLDEQGDEVERQSEMSVDPSSSSSEPELQDSGDEPLIPRGREKTYQTKRPAAPSERSPGRNSSKRQRVTPEESRPLTVLEKDQVGEKEYTFELPYRSNRIWVLRCPVCPDFQFKTNCLAYPYNLTKHCKFTDKGGEDTEKRHRRFAKRFKNNSAYLVKNCIFEVMGADFDWAVTHNAQGGLSNMTPMAGRFAGIELPDRKPAKQAPQQPQPTKAPSIAPKPSIPGQVQTVPDQEDEAHAKAINPPRPPPRREEDDEIRVLGHYRIRAPVTCDGKTVKVEPQSSEEE